MPKKAPIKKPVNKDESDDDYDNDNDNNEDVEEVDVEEFDDEDDDEEKDELDIEPDTESGNGCAVQDAIEDDDKYFDNNEDTELPVEQNSEYISKENRVSSNRLTKYEMVRILGERNEQLTMGAKPMIKNHQGLSYEKIAEEEFKRNMIPFKIKRPLPNGKFEIWTLDELYKEHLMSQLE
jgi:DNA-directed RNA polymerase subunit K/omega